MLICSLTYCFNKLVFCFTHEILQGKLVYLGEVIVFFLQVI